MGQLAYSTMTFHIIGLKESFSGVLSHGSLSKNHFRATLMAERNVK
jgi:hypothetical protein